MADAPTLKTRDAYLRFVPPPVVRRLQHSPFFSEELAYALRDSAVIEIVGGECRLAAGLRSLDHVEVPDTLQGVITSRIDRLNPTQQLMLKSASVVGRSFPFDILRDIFPIEGDREALSGHMDILVRSDMTLLETPAPDLAYVFKHIITQEVAYSHMLFSHRRQLHRAVAEWYERSSIEPESIYPLLAYHWTMAEEESRAVEYLEKAGEQALHSGAYAEARSFMEEAIRLNVTGQKSSQAADVLRQARHERLLGEAHLGLGHSIEGKKHLEDVLVILNMPIPGSLLLLIGPLLGETARQMAHRMWPSRFDESAAGSRTMLLEAVRVYERPDGEVVGQEGFLVGSGWLSGALINGVAPH